MSRRAAAYVALLTAVAIWGVTFHVVNYATGTLPIFLYLALRFWVATAAFLVVLQLGHRLFGSRSPDGGDESRGTGQPSAEGEGSNEKHPPVVQGRLGRWQVWLRERLGGLTTLSAVVVAVCLVLFYWLQTTVIAKDAVNAAFLTATFVLWVPFTNKLLDFKAKVSSRTYLGIIISVVGLAVLENFDFNNISYHDFLGLAGALALAVEVTVVSEAAKGADSRRLMGWTAKYHLFIALAFSAALLLTGGIAKVTPPSVGAVGALLFTGLLSTAVANFMANWANSVCDVKGNQLINSVHRAIMENLDAPIALLFAIAFLVKPSTIPANRYIGCVLVTLGVLVAEANILSLVWRVNTPQSEAEPVGDS